MADFRFLCPRCKGRTFGSSEQKNGTLRMCHSVGCHYQWRSENDFRVFKVNGVGYTSRAMYEAAVLALPRETVTGVSYEGPGVRP